jgi:dihydroxynaphthoic acid synthetase
MKGRIVPEDLLVETRYNRMIVTINRPEVLNALRTQTYEELHAAIDAATKDDTIGVVVLTGAGDRAFSSGGDVRGQQGRTVRSGREHLRTLLGLGHAMFDCGKPIIAAVNGYALGSGHELHLMCDLTIASEQARFGQTGPRVGSVPLWGGTQMLPALVGEKRAREFIFLCRQYTAQQAFDMGLVNAVVPHAELLAEADRWCEEILAKSPQSIRLAKTALSFRSDMFGPAFTHGMEMLALTYGSEENVEGISAFLEKRTPDFSRFRR